MLWGRGLLDVGICWRIGDESGVDVIQDRWIPSVYSKLSHQNSKLCEGIHVSSLIANRRWDEPMIWEVPFIAHEILKIPSIHNFVLNSRYWNFDPKGKYGARWLQSRDWITFAPRTTIELSCYVAVVEASLAARSPTESPSVYVASDPQFYPYHG